MGNMKPLIVQQIGQQIRDCVDDLSALDLVNKHYAEIVWSLEKDEWEQLSGEDQLLFVQIVRKHR